MRAKKSLGLKPKRFARAKKALGQNFLKSESVLQKIVEAGGVGGDDVVLEIGPGKGALTAKLLESAKQVIAVEKDDGLYEHLQEKFAEHINRRTLVLVHGDVLEFNPSQEKYKIIANIPYNITGAIIKKFLTEKIQPSLMVLMVQHEVAQRILARPAKSGFRESLLSIGVKAYGEPKIITKVGKKYFSPKPRVDSAVILIKNISRHLFEENNIDENLFWKVVRAGFAHKRKKLAKNLKSLEISVDFEVILEQISLPGGVRAESLSLQNWVNLVKHLNSHFS